MMKHLILILSLALLNGNIHMNNITTCSDKQKKQHLTKTIKNAPAVSVKLEKAGDKTSFAIVTDITYEDSKQRWCIGLLPSARPHYLAESTQSKAAVELMKYAMRHKLTLLIKSKETRTGNLKEPYITYIKIAPMDKQIQLRSDKRA